MFEAVLGSVSREQVLVFLAARGQGYGGEISRFFETDLGPIQKQLDRLENGGVLVSRKVGRTRVYEMNPRYALRAELLTLLQKLLDFYPVPLQERLRLDRRRPRRRSKPLA